MTIRRCFLVVFALIFIFAGNANALNYVDACNALIGGATGALDGIDGSSLSDGDRAVVTTDGVTYEYRLDASSGAAESSPSIISPDSNAGTKRWVLQGLRVKSIQLTTGGTPTEFSTDGTMAGNSDTAVPTEKAIVTYVASLAALGASSFPGLVERPAFSYKDTDEIYISPGSYNHNGTAEQIVYWNAAITFKFGSGGSNASSTDLAASDWFYLYIDDSAVVTLGAAELTASEFVAVTTEPTYSVAKHGWYSGSDRCIAAFRTDGSSQILSFYHDGGPFMQYDGEITDRAMADLDATQEDVTLTLPSFATMALVHFKGDAKTDTDIANLKVRANGSSSDGTTLFNVSDSGDAPDVAYSFKQCATDSSQKIEVWYSEAGDHEANIRTGGYFFPKGM